MTDKLVEEIARAIAEELGDDFTAAFENKSAWIEARGGLPYRDVNMPYRGDYIRAATAAATLSHKRIAELEELLRSAHNAMGTAVDCIADGQPARLEYAQERLQGGIDGILAALNTKETDRGE